MMERFLDLVWKVRFGTMRVLLRACLLIIGNTSVDLVGEAAAICVERRGR